MRFALQFFCLVLLYNAGILNAKEKKLEMLYPTGDCTQQGENPHSPRFRNYNEGIRYVAVQRGNLAKYEENNRYNEC